MTKPAVWVQITEKKYTVDDKNLLHLKYPIIYIQIISIFSLCNYKDFLSKKVLSYSPKIDDFEIEEPWKIWKLVFMSPNQKMSRELIVGSQVLLSLQQFYLTKENLKMFYNLEGIPMKALEARSDTEWFGWVKSQITAHLFQISIYYYPWGGSGAWNNTQSIVSTRLWIKYNNCIVLNHYKIFEGFCLGTFYAILIYRDIGCKLLGKSMEFQ